MNAMIQYKENTFIGQFDNKEQEAATRIQLTYKLIIINKLKYVQVYLTYLSGEDQLLLFALKSEFILI